MTGYLYEFYNTVNGKSYVGCTKNGQVRIEEHFKAAEKGARSILECAIRKYGKKVFEVRIRLVKVRDRNHLHQLEREEIKRLNSITPGGYNIREGSDRGQCGMAFRALASVAAKLRWKSPGYRRKMSKALSEAMKLVHQNPEVSHRRTESIRRTKRTPEHRLKVAENAKLKWQDPEYRRKQTETFQSLKYHRKRSKSQKRLWQNSEYRKKMSAAHKGDLGGSR